MAGSAIVRAVELTIIQKTKFLHLTDKAKPRTTSRFAFEYSKVAYAELHNEELHHTTIAHAPSFCI